MLKHKYIKTFLITVIAITVLFSANVALAKAPKEIDTIAKEDFKSFLPSLSSQKEHFGLSSEDDVINNAKLGEGYEYYQVSTDAIKKLDNVGNKPKIDMIFKPSGKYIYPILVGDKQAGVAFVGKINGQYRVTRISSYIEFNDDIIDAKNIVKQKLAKYDISDPFDYKVVYDPENGAVGICYATKHDEYFISIRKGVQLGTSKGQIDTIHDYSDKIKKLIDNKEKQLKAGSKVVGGLTGKSENDIEPLISTQWYTIGSVTLIIVLVGFIFYVKRRITV